MRVVCWFDGTGKDSYVWTPYSLAVAINNTLQENTGSQGSYDPSELVEVDEELCNGDAYISRRKALLAGFKDSVEQPPLRSTGIDYGCAR